MVKMFNLFDEIEGEEDLSQYTFIHEEDKEDKEEVKERVRIYIEDYRYELDEEKEEEEESEGYVTWNINEEEE